MAFKLLKPNKNCRLCFLGTRNNLYCTILNPNEQKLNIRSRKEEDVRAIPSMLVILVSACLNLKT